MVCEEDVFLWFRELSGHKRIDVMCSLLNKCLPFELRFFGTCLEDLGKQYFTQMKDVEVKANNPLELSELLVQCIISDTRTRQKLALYICLVHSLNTTCSNSLYKTLISLDMGQIMSLAKNCDDKDENKNVLDELLLIYTIAVNHPAFTFEQKANLGNILLNMRREEENLRKAKLAETLNALSLTSETTEVASPEMPPPSIPPGLNYPPGLSAAGNYIPIPAYAPFHLQQIHHPSFVWQVGLVNIPSMPTEPIPVAEMVPFPPSPQLSRQSSPSQSASPSRTTSPSRKPPQRVERSNSQPRMRPTFTDHALYPAAKKGPERFDPQEGAAVKPEDETRGFTERKGDSVSEEIRQLRTAVISMNGITDPEHREFPHAVSKQKVCVGAYENEMSYVPILPRPLEPNMLSNPHPSIVPLKPCCINQMVGAGPRYTHPPAYCQHTLHALSLDHDGSRHCSSSSSSDASSTSHSPPATPATLNQNWEKGGLLGGEKPATPDRTNSVPVKMERVRLGLGRGVQTLPRGRGPHSAAPVDSARRDGPRSAPPTPHDDKKVYAELPSVASPHVSQTPVVSSHVSQSPVVSSPLSLTPVVSPLVSDTPSPAAVAGKPPPSHDMVAVPYPSNPAPAPFVPAHFSAPPMFPPYHSTFVRPSFPFPNGDMMFPYQQHPFPPPVVTYSTTVPPPKVSCYNCSSQTHHANDCKEPTMEEYSIKGQYRIDYKPYPKPGECLSEK